MNALKRLIEKKANDKDVTTIFEVQDVKINSLDHNSLLLAKDFKAFQKVISRMHQSIIELQEVNKDLLLGKKSANCLSCNKGNDGFEARANVVGRDGRLYVGEGKNAKKTREDAERGGSPGNRNSGLGLSFADFNTNKNS